MTKTDGGGGGDEHHSKCQWMFQVERSLNLICIWKRWLWLLGVGEGGPLGGREGGSRRASMPISSQEIYPLLISNTILLAPCSLMFLVCWVCFYFSTAVFPGIRRVPGT